MKRFHLHVAVEDIEQSVRFYSALFATPPIKHLPDYAKWMLDDPRVNFAISKRGAKPGIDHVGFQVDSAEELIDLRSRLEAADAEILDEADTACCYARSDKHWITDPSGIAWESFHTLADIPTFHGRETVAPASTPLVSIPIQAGAAACCSAGTSCGPRAASA